MRLRWSRWLGWNANPRLKSRPKREGGGTSDDGDRFASWYQGANPSSADRQAEEEKIRSLTSANAMGKSGKAGRALVVSTGGKTRLKLADDA